MARNKPAPVTTKQRVDRCAEEVKAVLAKHKCQLVATPIIRPDGTLDAIARVVLNE